MSGSTWTWIGGTIDLENPSDWMLTAGPGNGSGIPQTGDTAINNGTLVGYGLIAADLINNSTVEASNNSVPGASIGGDLEIQGAVSGSGSMTIAPGATLQIDGALGAAQTIAFGSGEPEVLILGSPTGMISNPITGLDTSDAIEFGNSVTITNASVVNGNTIAVNFTDSGGTLGTYDLTDVGFATGSSHQFSVGVDSSTDDGYVQVGTVATRPSLTTLVGFGNTYEAYLTLA